MDHFYYESHKLENTELPFIFHLDKGVSNDIVAFNWHREVEFLYVVSGSGVFMCDAQSFELTKGDIFAINSNSIHSTKSVNNLSYYCLIVDSEFCRENGIDTDNVAFENKVADSVAASLYEAITEEFKKDDIYSVAAVRSSVLSFMVHMARNHTGCMASPKSNTGKKSIENMRAAIDYIRQHFTERITLDEIASSIGVSKCHFAREFKKLMGMTPIGYINMLKVETAAKMLESGKNTVGETQLICGFDNSSYFTKVFKMYFGVAPTEFKKKPKKFR